MALKALVGQSKFIFLRNKQHAFKTKQMLSCNRWMYAIKATVTVRLLTRNRLQNNFLLLNFMSTFVLINYSIVYIHQELPLYYYEKYELLQPNLKATQHLNHENKIVYIVVV